MKKIMLALIAIPIFLGVTYLFSPALNVEKFFGPTASTDDSANTTPASYALKNLYVADMHADTLLWKRNIAERSEIGHADLHRLLDVNVGLQVFMSVVEAPDDVDSDSIKQEGDQITTVALLDKWPYQTLGSYKERALYHASKLFKASESSNEKLKVLLNREDLATGAQNWQSKGGPLLAILGMEGAHATEFKVENVEELFDAGFRSMGLAHYSDTEFAGSSSGMSKHGLTDKGRALIKKMNAIGMIVDVAHLSNQGIEDVLNMTEKSVYSSHTGVYATCPKARNLPDPIIKKIAQREGVIGIGFFAGAICGSALEDTVMAIKHVRDLVGSEYVGLGSGWDVASLAILPTELPDLTQALLDQGFSEKEVRDVMGRNIVRFFLENLPSKEYKSI